MKNNLDCTIIILSYNNSDIIDTCLNKVEAAVKESQEKLHNKVNIVAVDNHSVDRSVDLIKKHPLVKLIVNKENLGTSIGNNIALREAKTPYLLLINTDTFLEKDTLVKVFSYIQTQKKCDVLCVKLKHGDGSFQASGGFLPTPLRIILWALGIESLPFVKKIIQPFYQYDPSFYEKEQYPGWYTTSFFFLRREVFNQTKGMDERIFIHMEDVEWCKRIKDKGFTLKFTPSITVTHLGGKSTKRLQNRTLLSQHLTGLAYFHKKHYPQTWIFVWLSLQFGMVLRALFFICSGNLNKAQAYIKAPWLLQ